MFVNLYNQKLFLSYIKYLIILLFFWGSLNTGSKYLSSNYLNNIDFINFINLIRALLPYFIICYFVVVNYKLKKTDFLNFDLIFKLFVFYGLLQISGLIYLNNNLHQHYWVVCLFSLLIFYNSIEKENNDDLINFILLANILIISVIFLVFVFLAFKENILSKDLVSQMPSLVAEFAKERAPRSTGLSRMALLIFIFFNAIYFSNYFKNFIILFINTILISIILLFQSRGILIAFLLVFLGINFVYKFKDLKHRIFFFISTILLPILIFVAYPNIKNYLIKKMVPVEVLLSDEYRTGLSSKSLKFKNLEIKLRDDFDKSWKVPDDIPISIINEFTNNRFEAWSFLTQMFFFNSINKNMKIRLEYDGYSLSEFKKINKKNYLTGYGPQFDRYLLTNNSLALSSEVSTGPFGHHASNGIVYSIISSGVIGMIVFIILNLIIFYRLTKILICNISKGLNDKPFLSASIFIILFLQFRILFENSYSVYGVDLIFFLSSYLIINHSYKEITNKKI